MKKRKWCVLCRADHELAAFNKDAGEADGLHEVCREEYRRFHRAEGVASKEVGTVLVRSLACGRIAGQITPDGCALYRAQGCMCAVAKAYLGLTKTAQ